jgi:hypothetical protein
VQRRGGGSRARRNTAQQRQRRPVAHATAPLAAVFLRDIVTGKRQDVVEECPVVLAEGVGGVSLSLRSGNAVSVSR